MILLETETASDGFGVRTFFGISELHHLEQNSHTAQRALRQIVQLGHVHMKGEPKHCRKAINLKADRALYFPCSSETAKPHSTAKITAI